MILKNQTLKMKELKTEVLQMINIIAKQTESNVIQSSVTQSNVESREPLFKNQPIFGIKGLCLSESVTFEVISGNQNY